MARFCFFSRHVRETESSFLSPSFPPSPPLDKVAKLLDPPAIDTVQLRLSPMTNLLKDFSRTLSAGAVQVRTTSETWFKFFRK